MTEASERRLSEIVTGKESPQSGLDKLALDLQQISRKQSANALPCTQNTVSQPPGMLQ